MNPKLLDALERQICTKLKDFMALAWQTLEPANPLIPNWHLDFLAEHLEACARGEINRLLINIPPGTSKSTLTSVIFPAWLWGPFGQPEMRILGASHEQGLAIRDSRKNRLLVESQWYQRLWPTQILSDQNEKMYFENKSYGFRQATAVASMTGRRGDFVILDDPQSPEKAYSPLSRQTTIRVFTETLPSRLRNPEKSVIIVIMQRLHQEDISGYILQNDFGYEHVFLPMEFIPEKRCQTSLGLKDPRKKEGDLLFPQRFSKKVVERDKKIMGAFAAAGQLQQSPIPRGGSLFKQEWFGFFKEEPKLISREIFADTAQKTSNVNDFSVFQLWGYTTNQAFLLDQVRGKWEAPELLVQARAFWNKHSESKNGHLRSFRVEDKVSGTGLIQTLKREGIPTIGIPRSKDKVTRAQDVAPLIESGLVFLPQNAPFLSNLMDELTNFPLGKHDDQVDPFMDALTFFFQKNDYELKDMLLI